MKKIKRYEKSNLSDTYEDFVRLEKLDAYEAQIKSNKTKKINLMNNISYYCLLEV